MDMYVDNIGESYVELVKEIPRYGLTDNLRFAQTQQKLLKELLGVDGEIFGKSIFIKKKNVPIDEIVDSENVDEKYYIFENDSSQAVSRIEDTGNIELSFQKCYKMTRDYEVERVKKRLEDYGLRGYKLKEVTVQVIIEKLES